MEITDSGLEFDSDDVLNLRAFLKTRTGSRLLPKIAEAAPGLLPAGETNSILIRNGEMIGFQSAIRAILTLANPPPDKPAKTATEYPALLDDAAFEGVAGLAGEKIQVPTPQ